MPLGGVSRCVKGETRVEHGFVVQKKITKFILFISKMQRDAEFKGLDVESLVI